MKIVRLDDNFVLVFVIRSADLESHSWNLMSWTLSGILYFVSSLSSILNEIQPTAIRKNVIHSKDFACQDPPQLWLEMHPQHKTMKLWVESRTNIYFCRRTILKTTKSSFSSMNSHEKYFQKQFTQRAIYIL